MSSNEVQQNEIIDEEMKRIICIGLAVLDHVFYLPRIPNQPIKNFATNYQTAGGGNTATAAVAISRAGGQAVFWGNLGDDLNGDIILSELEGFGVNVEDVYRLDGLNSSVSTVLIDNKGERQITNYTDQKLLKNPDWLPLDKLGNSHAVLADLRWEEGAIKALCRARELGIPGVLDAYLMPEVMNEEVIKNATHVLFSEPALNEFTQSKSMVESLHRVEEINRGWVGVTEGASGTRWLDNGKLKHVPAFKVKAVDTLGAGDVFHGIFALSLAEGHLENIALIRASAAAALHCSRLGGRKTIPLRKEIESFIRQKS